MNTVSKVMRATRFKIKDPNKKLKLRVETMTGGRFEFSLVNCSISGLAVTYQGVLSSSDGFEEGSLIPAAKLICDANEITLGRLVLRRLVKNDGVCDVAFSTIDNRIPVDGVLSRYIACDLDARHNPYEFELSPDKFNTSFFREGSQTNVDIFQRAKQFQIFYKDWQKSSKFQYYNIRLPSHGNRIKLTQRWKGNRNDYLVVSSNDYLGLASAPEVVDAAKKALDAYGFGSTGSGVMTGLTAVHEELCEYIAKLLNREKVLLFNSGYTANVGIITALSSAQDLLAADLHSHASIQDGMRMSNATSRFFKHNDPQHLDKILSENEASHNGILVITEGVFSMDGSVPPLDKIAQVARKHNARLMVDEAHSFGVIGPTGLGCWEKYPNVNVDLLMGTFSKICGSIGGFAAGSEEVINWLHSNARAYMFSVTVPPSTAAATLAALKMVTAHPELINRLQANIKHFVAGLRHLGCPIKESHESAVIPVVVGDENKLGIMNEVFRNEGVYVIPIIYPAVARTQCRFRFTMMATHSTSDLDYVLSVLEKAMLKANFQFPSEESKEGDVLARAS